MTTKWPKQSPNQFNSTKISPKSLGNFFLEKNHPMLKTFAQIAIFFQIWSHWLSTKEWLSSKVFWLKDPALEFVWAWHGTTETPKDTLVKKTTKTQALHPLRHALHIITMVRQNSTCVCSDYNQLCEPLQLLFAPLKCGCFLAVESKHIVDVTHYIGHYSWVGYIKFLYSAFYHKAIFS
jgi:hypothetical protein